MACRLYAVPLALAGMALKANAPAESVVVETGAEDPSEGATVIVVLGMAAPVASVTRPVSVAEVALPATVTETGVPTGGDAVTTTLSGAGVGGVHVAITAPSWDATSNASTGAGWPAFVEAADVGPDPNLFVGITAAV